MGRPNKDKTAIRNAKKRLQKHPVQRMLGVYLVLSQREKMRLQELWEHPLVRLEIHSKSVFYQTLTAMHNAGIVKVEKLRHKVVIVTLLKKPSQLDQGKPEETMTILKEEEENTKAIVETIASGIYSEEEIIAFIGGMFVQSEQRRLYTMIQLLPMLSDPILWPQFCAPFMQYLIMFPIIMQLQLLRACEEKYPRATISALNMLDKSLTRTLSADHLKDYRKIRDSPGTSS